MNRKPCLRLFVLTIALLAIPLLTAWPATAQDRATVDPPPAAGVSPAPYAGLETREIKALSPEEIERYLAGEGMGYAMAAELNGYPGPKHVLELADELELGAEQREAVEASFDRMHREAVRLGKEIVELERRLDQTFAGGSATPGEVDRLLEEIARLESRLRGCHLRAHLETKVQLSAHQIARYVELRGYTAPGGHAGHHRPRPR